MDTTNQPIPQKQAEPPSEEPRYSTLLSVLHELAPSFYALAVGALYASGFLVLNSYLAKFGVLDIELVNPRYFLAGVSFAFFLVCFFLFAGRAAMLGEKWVRQDLEWFNKDKPSYFWSVIVYLHGFISVILFCCLSAAMFSSFAIDPIESIVFYATLSVSFIIRYTLDITNLDLKFKKPSKIVQLIVDALAIYGFFIFVGTGTMLSVFFIYLGIVVFINFVIDGFNRYQVTTDRITFTGVYAVVFLIGTAGSYGTLLYNQVNTKLGGPSPQSVSVGLLENVRESLPMQVATSSNKVLEGILIHQTPSYVYIASSGYTLRLRAEDVVALVLKPEPARQWLQFLREYFHGATTAPLPPDRSPKGASDGQSVTVP